MQFVGMFMLEDRVIWQLDPTSTCVQAARSSGLSRTTGLPGPFEVVCTPQMHMTGDLSKEKFSRPRSQLMTWCYGTDLFSARRETSLSQVTRAAGPMLPVAEKTNEVKDPFSTSKISCWTHCQPPIFCRFSFSCFLYTAVWVDLQLLG